MPVQFIIGAPRVIYFTDTLRAGKAGIAVKRIRAKKWLRLPGAMAAVAVGAGLLLDAPAVAEGIRGGLSVCGNVLIPSLFPFMALAGLVSRTELARILSMPLAPLTKRLYRLPADLGVVVLLGMVGGYPVGAKMLAGLLGEGRISRETAQRMLYFCINSGPSFVVSAVGAGMLGDMRAGVILFATQTLATLLIGALVSVRAQRQADMPPPEKKGGAAVFVGAVSGAASAVIDMCAFAILFSGLLALLEASGLIGLLASALHINYTLLDALARGLFEVTNGCIAAAAIGGEGGFMLISAFVSFSGLSVIFQVLSCFRGESIRILPVIAARLCHAVLSCAFAVPLYRDLCGTEYVWKSAGAPVMHADNKTLLISGCLLAMCTILVLSAGKETK